MYGSSSWAGAAPRCVHRRGGRLGGGGEGTGEGTRPQKAEAESPATRQWVAVRPVKAWVGPRASTWRLRKSTPPRTLGVVVAGHRARDALPAPGIGRGRGDVGGVVRFILWEEEISASPTRAEERACGCGLRQRRFPRRCGGGRRAWPPGAA